MVMNLIRLDGLRLLIKTKDNPPSLNPSLKLRLSKKAMVVKESIKIKVKRVEEQREWII
jgi:hypothetical protein